MATETTPARVLILGAGVFGLSTAYALAKRPTFADSEITIVAPELEDDGATATGTGTCLPASIDSNRIIRADYVDPLYADLAREARSLWRTEEWGSRGRYHEVGFLITCSDVNILKAMAKARTPGDESHIRELWNEGDVADAMRAGPAVARGTGEGGYVNLQSGWADAASCMADLKTRVRATRRVNLVAASASSLLTGAGGTQVCGARLDDGRSIEADLTILATGAWTASLVNLDGLASCTAQVIAYFDISDDEARLLSDIPVHMNFSTGCFVFPPNKKAGGGWEIKAARHTYGYSNPTKCPPPLGAEGGEYQVSLPSSATSIPESDSLLLCSFLGEALPLLKGRTRPSRTRLCHYSDTVAGDFLVGYYPGFSQTLFLATGDSGHAFKMLPVIGEKVTDVLGREGSYERWAQAWAIPESPPRGQVWCEDGSRGGTKGLTLADALSR